MRSILTAIVVGSAFGAVAAPSLAGDTTLPNTNQFFRAQKVDGRWWLIAPDGQRFISKGVTTVQFAQDTIRGTGLSPYRETNVAKYGSIDAWRKAVAARLIGWGFNSLGAWSDDALAKVTVDGKRLADAPIVDLGATYVGEKQRAAAWLQGVFPDVFDPEFERLAHRVARERCTARAGDRWLLGWFTDNELRWGPDWRGSEELLTMFLMLPASMPGKTASVDFLRERYGSVTNFNGIWKTTFDTWDSLMQTNSIQSPVVRKAIYLQNQEAERQENDADPKRAAYVADCEAFLSRLAERYFRITSEAIRAADPNHMNFGCRFAYVPPQPVIAAAAKYVDAISFNCYRLDPREVIARYSAFGKPLIIGEFSFRGEDAGLPNTRGAGPKVKTQSERAAAFKEYVTLALANPNLVGYHWFEHCDQPREGRFDGEDSNYGVVNIRDEVYEELTRAMTEINAKAESLHEGVAVSK